MTASGPTTYVLKSDDYYRNFKNSIKSKYTFDTYDRKLKAYMKYMGISVEEGQYSELIEGKDIRLIESDITKFISSLKDRDYSLASQQLYLTALIHSYSINDITLNRKKISKFMSNDDNIIIVEEENNFNNQGEGGVLVVIMARSRAREINPIPVSKSLDC